MIPTASPRPGCWGAAGCGRGRNRPAPAPPDAYTAAGDDLAITGVLPEDAGVSRAALPTKPLWIGKVRVG